MREKKKWRWGILIFQTQKDYGHSFGHAIESATAYAVPHGIAVTIGADIANYASWRMGFTAKEVYDELHVLLARNYRGFESVAIPEQDFFSAIGKDKKNRDDKLSLILMNGPGDLFRHQCENDEKFRSICREYFATRV